MPNIAYIRPDVKESMPDWTLVNDCIKGQRQVKSKKELYLPKPSGDLDPEYAEERYKAYLTRALFYNGTGRTADGLVGQVFGKEPETKLPSDLQPYEEDIDGYGTSLTQQSKLVLKQNVSVGHGGLMVDYPKPEKAVSMADINSGRIRPRILNVLAENIINWRMVNIGGETKLQMLMIYEEVTVSDDGYEQEKEPRWRDYQLRRDESGFYVTVSVWKENDSSDPNNKEQYVRESGPDVIIADGRRMDTIPFIFYGALNNEPTIDKPPMLDLANLNIGHYRNSADYEESVFIVGQPTPVFTGLTQDWVDNNIKGKVVLGSRAAIGLPENATADLMQADPNSMPYEGMKQKEDQMKSIGAKLIEPGFTKTTATQVLVDASSESSILTTATENVSAAYQSALKFFRMFIGGNDDQEIVFQLNTDYDVDRMDAQERSQTILEWQAGAITWDEMREALRLAGVAKMDNEEAKRIIDRELEDIPGNEPNE